MLTKKLIFGNSEEELKKIKENSIDLIVTSPPYDNLRNYDGELQWNFNIFSNIAKELGRILKEGGIIVWIVNDATIKGSETLTSFKQALFFTEKCGLNLLDTMIWKKPSPFNFGSNNAYIQSFEYMFIFCKGKPKTKNFIYDRPLKNKGAIIKQSYKNKNNEIIKTGGIYKSGDFGKRHNVWEINTANKNKGHPAVFPENIVRDHIKTWSNEGDNILDPFMGSGTTGKVSLDLKRNFIGIEIVKDYFNISQNILSKY